MKAWRGAVAALGFFTRIPTGGRALRQDLPGALPWLPAIGLVLGGAGAGLDALFGAGAPRLSAVLVVGLWALLAGGLHLEGLADVCDALGSSRRGEEAYRILKDPHVGAYGVLGVVLVLLVQVEAIALLAPGHRARVLAVAPLLGRVIPTAGLLLLDPPPYVTSGLAYEARKAEPRFAGAAAIVGAAVAIAVGSALPALVGLVVGGGALFAMTRPLGGLTGDLCGAAIEIGVSAYLVAAALW